MFLLSIIQMIMAHIATASTTLCKFYFCYCPVF